MAVGPSPEVLAAMQQDPVAPSEDRLEKLRKAVAAVRDLEARKSDLETSLKEVNIRLQEQYYKELPDLLGEVGVSEITISADGNMPAVVAKSKPYYHAVISAEWPEDQKAAAFKYLDDEGHGDLIVTEVAVSFPREQRAAAIKFAKKVNASGMVAQVQQKVHWATLTSWLKDMIETKKVMPPLETIGATVGRVVKLSPVKE